MNKKLIILFSVTGLLIIAAIFVTFVSPKKCMDFDCFKNSMGKCYKSIYVNEGDYATWKYQILGMKGKECEVEVTLLQPKKGNLEVKKLEGSGMTCTFPKGIFNYPERDLSICHGRLKEELQEIAIKKLHSYILENLGELKETLDLFSNSS